VHVSVGARVRDQRGFTLVELLAGISAGAVLMLALFAVVDFSTRQAISVGDRVEASQRGRTALERLIQELHSSCVAASASPVLAGSDGSNIQFISQFGSAPVLTPDIHKVSLSGSNLTDQIFAASGGSAPTWTYSATPTGARTILSNVAQASVGGSVVPVFQYYKYVGGVLTGPLPTPLSAADAQSTVEVTVTFVAGPSSGSTVADRQLAASGSAVLRYVPADATPGAANPPCQ
jgi:prepilin-type N-terminal cleavage/methylation domain-containing protein